VLQSNVEDISASRASADRELIEKKSVIDSVGIELIELGNTLGHLNELVESLKSNLDKVSCERDHLQEEIMILEGKVQTAYALANETAAIAAEAQEVLLDMNTVYLNLFSFDRQPFDGVFFAPSPCQNADS